MLIIINFASMRLAIFGREFSNDFNEAVYKIFETLNRNNVEIFVFEEYFKFINDNLYFFPKISGTFKYSGDMPENLNLIISIGGDGTMLECVQYAIHADIPVIGINGGRLGFLATISVSNLLDALNDIISGRYIVEKRTLLELYCESNRFGDLNFALNELTIMRVGSMISIDVWLDEEFLNTYWSDGLIIATPTGSTAYSLSAGGPIITPGSGNFVITPVSPHNLSVRPIVISDNNVLRLKANGRGRNFLASLDYRQACFDFSEELLLRKSDKSLKLAKLSENDFYSTLRNKLLWGMDKRN